MRRLLLAVFAVLASAIASELALRWTFSEGFTPAGEGGLEFIAWDPFRGNYLIPGHETGLVRINSDGRRGPELDPSRPRLLVCMGDSSTFGLWMEGVEERVLHFDSYPQLLSEEVERAGLADWQVVNAGVPGSTVAHSLRILRREILRLQPEIITLRIGLNDHGIRGRFIREPQSALLRRLLYFFGNWKLFGLLVEADHQYRPEKPGTPRVPEAEFRSDLIRFVEIARGRGIRVVFIDYPLRPPRSEDLVARQTAGFFGGKDVRSYYETHERYQSLVRQVAREQGVPLLSTHAQLLDRTRFGFSDDIVHPSATGMQTIASSLFRFLVEQNLLDPARGQQTRVHRVR